MRIRRRRWRLALLQSEAAPGVVLLASTAVAMAAANSPLGESYHALFHAPLAWTPLAPLGTLHGWINDALMALFFFVVGLEIKRECLAGALADRRTRRLPIIAAAAGMAAPALIYLAVAGGDRPLIRGWAIPAATDIAFAMGVVALLGKRVPPALRLFLLTVAIVDDIGAVAIIALAYTDGLSLPWAAGAAAILGAMGLLNRYRVATLAPYLLLALGLWLAVLHSGLHPTVAGIAAALTIPLRLDSQGDSPLLRLEHALVPVVGFIVVPLFALANAGVPLAAGDGDGSLLAWAIGLGLVVGKQAGILAAVYVVARLGGGRVAGASWLQVWGIALLCGIGFTMSLFIASLAFPLQPALIAQAQRGVLAGSLVSAVAGYLVLRFAPAPRGRSGQSMT
ncbi:MAG: Na+/H+ antiporter NhaA [Novosphingobium sp.]